MKNFLFAAMSLGVMSVNAPQAIAAETWTLQAYSGYQSAPHSTVTGTGGGGDFEFRAGWEGRSFTSPPYYGLRATRWLNDQWGVGAEFTHTKVYADDETLADAGLTVLEFSDGLNILTLNAVRRFNLDGPWTPYAGAGFGISVPHVEFQEGPADPKTFEYQFTGPAARIFAGVSYGISQHWSVFTEYNGTYSRNSADLEGGGTLETNIITNAMNFGVGFTF